MRPPFHMCMNLDTDSKSNTLKDEFSVCQNLKLKFALSHHLIKQSETPHTLSTAKI